MIHSLKVKGEQIYNRVDIKPRFNVKTTIPNGEFKN